MTNREDGLIAETKALIREVEAGQTAHAAWVAIQDRVKRLSDKRSQSEVGRLIGKSRRWVQKVLTWDRGPTPFADPDDPRKGGGVSSAKRILGDPDQRRKVLSELPPSAVEAVIEDANEVALDRVRARRAEHETRPTTRDLMGSDPFKPDEFWADNVVISINRKARELASLIQRGGGLLLGAMEVEQAFDYLNEAERLIAEARAAAQEMSRDKAGV